MCIVTIESIQEALRESGKDIFLAAKLYDRFLRLSKIKIKKIKEPHIRVKKVKEKISKKRNRRKQIPKNIKELFKDIKQCTKCGYNKYLKLHHIDKDRENNNVSNIIKLCLYCHIKEHEDEAVVRIMRNRLEFLENKDNLIK